MRLADLLVDPERLNNVHSEDLPELLAELRKLEVQLELRMTTFNGHEKPAPAPPEKWLTPDEAAKRLKVDRRWIYKHAPKWRFARRISHKKLLISESGLTAWMAANKA